MAALSQECQKHELSQRLCSITLTVPKDGPLIPWFSEISNMLSSARLQEFQIYTLGGDLNPQRHLPEQFVSQFIQDHGSRLLKFAVHRLRTSLVAVDMICRGCPHLGQLFIVLDEKDLVSPYIPPLKHTPHL
jgi:hypothetical protein